MYLTREEIANLLQLVGMTRDEEIHCDQCQRLIAEFAEKTLTSKTIPKSLEAVEHHLAMCNECREDYEALLQALHVMND